MEDLSVACEINRMGGESEANECFFYYYLNILPLFALRSNGTRPTAFPELN